MEYINTKNSDVSDLFKDLNLPQSVSKDARREIEDYYVEVRIEETDPAVARPSAFLEIQTIHHEQ